VKKAEPGEAGDGAPTKAPVRHSLGAMYREGNTGTRLQVLAFYVFVLIALVSAGSLFMKVANKMRRSTANEQLKKDYTNEFAEVRRKAIESADMISLGQFTATGYVGAQEEKMMKMDLWIRVSDPAAATAIDTKNEIFRDKTMDALNNLSVAKVNLLTEAGKTAAREQIRAALNSALKQGEVKEVYIQNLIAQ